MKVKTILFDLDGTLLDTNRMIIESWKHTHRQLKQIEKDEAEIIATFGEPLKQTLASEFPDVPVEKSAKIYREFQAGRFFEMLDIFPGIPEMLEALKTKGYQMGVVTSRLKESSIRGLQKYDLLPYFDGIVTADDCDKHKPDPEPILKALEMLGAKPEETVMVGDSIFDIGCAQNAGTRSVYVAWSITQPDFAGDVKPDYIAHSAREIVDIIAG